MMAVHTDKEIKELIQKMTLEEKCGMLSGADYWHTKTVNRLGIDHIMVSDGPHGLRKQNLEKEESSANESIKAICFPAACATASSFDRDVLKKLGDTLAKECQQQDVSTILGPAVNIKRSPLCGRNFEYISEDPYLAGELAASYINSVQSHHVGTSIKHFALNNQEYRRLTSSSNCDERTMREIYLTAFEKAVRQSQPATIMHSYNKINHEYTGESKWLLTDVLRKEWGYKGIVMSDWGAVNDRVKGLIAGEDLEMPTSGGINDKKVLDAVKKNPELEKNLNETCERLLKWIFSFLDNREDGEFDFAKHHDIARELEEESIVLLKNDGILPLKKEQKIAVIGEFASKPRIQGGGSSHINTDTVVSPIDAFKNSGITFDYVQGYYIDKTEEDDAVLSKEALDLAQNSSIIVFFAGLPDSYESEGYDRTHLNLPPVQNKLIDQISKVNSNIVVVLQNGSPVLMPWAEKVNAIVEAYLGGEAVGEAAVNILTGKVNPSGKLAETFPLRLEDTPAYLNFSKDKHNVDYGEGIFVGYRYYDSRKMDVAYPFGYGLSYTTFEYSNISVSKDSFSDDETLSVTVSVKNTGSVAGKEVVQLYIKDNTDSSIRPEKELKGFEKVMVEPGQTKTVSFTINKRSLAWYNTDIHEWYAASGEYDILIGSSSRDIRLTKRINFKTKVYLLREITQNTTVGDLMDDDRTCSIIKAFNDKNQKNSKEIDSSEKEAITDRMSEEMLDSTPLRTLHTMGFNLKEDDYTNLLKDLNKAIQ
ncbi:MAG: glycoside hydrolase family 3 C-terminal domain-containing protein [Treponema sp.]|nr:glycoside hydrolase family 3 C-terminal domain-containing protein [Treponema sp.]